MLSTLNVVRVGSKRLLQMIMNKTNEGTTGDAKLTDAEIYGAWPRISMDEFKTDVYSFLMLKTTGEARARVKVVIEEYGIHALQKIVYWYKGVSDAAREKRYHELANPDRVKKDAEIPDAVDSWLIKLREVEASRASKMEAWTKVMARKKILPTQTVEIVNAKDDMA